MMWSSASKGAESPRVRRIEDHRPPRSVSVFYPPTLERHHLLQVLGRCVVIAAVITLVAAALLLLARRLSAPLQPLPPFTLVLLGLLFAAMAAGLRSLWRSSSARPVSSRPDAEEASWLPPIVSSGTLLLLAVGLSIPGSHGLAWLLFGSILGLEEFLAWRTSRRAVLDQRGAVLDQRGAPALKMAFDSDETLQAPSTPAGESLRQQSVRSVGNGQEIVRAEYVCEFLAGERQQVVHIVFQPPFSRPPAVEASLDDAPHVTLKVAQIETYGVRLELRRRGDWSLPGMMPIRLTATASLEPE